MKFKQCKTYLLQNCDPSIGIDSPYYVYSLYDIAKFDTFTIESDDRKTVIVIAPVLYRIIPKILSPTNIIELTKDNIEILLCDFTPHIYDKYNIEIVKDYILSRFKILYFNEDARVRKMYFLNSIFRKNLNTFSKPLKFLFTFESRKDVNFGDLPYYYPEAFLTKSDDSCLHYLLITDSKKFLNKCISRFEPISVKLLNRVEYKYYESLYNMTKYHI